MRMMVTVPIFKFLRRSLDVSKAHPARAKEHHGVIIQCFHLEDNSDRQYFFPFPSHSIEGFWLLRESFAPFLALEAKAVQPMSDRGLVQASDSSA